MVRAEERSTLADTTVYNLPNGATYTAPVADQYYQRKVFTSVVDIRNRRRS